MKYDVFVSYRRTSFESANLIAEKLRSMGYSVFFDVESLRSGKFNEQLFDVIEECTDFVIVLPQNALDRCVDENDWVRKEVVHAIKSKKNIIPVMLKGFEWPSPMPAGMDDLSNYQAITAGEREYFDMSMKRLAGYFKSKPHSDMRRFYKKASVVVAIILACICIAMFSIRQTMVPLYKNVASNMTVGMGILDVLYYNTDVVQSLWVNFAKDYELCKTDDARTNICRGFEATLAEKMANVDMYYKQFTKLPAFTPTQSYLLGLYDITPQEIESFYAIFDMMFHEYKGTLSYISNMYENQHFNDDEAMEYNTKHLSLDFKMKHYMLDNLYYSYLEVMSKFPKVAQEQFEIQSPDWKNYPKGFGLDRTIEEYRRYQDEAFKNAERVMLEMEKNLSEFKGRVDVFKANVENN